MAARVTRALPFTVAGDRIVATFLGAQDVPWLARLLDEAATLAGRPEFVARDRFRRPLPGAPSPAVWQLAVDLLLRRLRAPLPPVPPRAIRGRLCAARAAWPDAPRERLVAQVAAALALPPGGPDGLEAAFVADLPGERRLGAVHADLTATTLVAAVNLEVAQAVLRRAVSLAVEAEEGVRTIVRVARLGGLICSVPEPAGAREPVVLVSGPLAVLTRTTAYGRAFASLLPRLPWCGRYRLRARCLVDGREARFELTSSDALLPAPPPRAFDSRLEARLAHDLLRAAPDWEIAREPAALRAGRALVFPDFAIRPRGDAPDGGPSPGAVVYVEIAGFWTAAYLERKLGRLRAAGLERLILCIDETRRCDDRAGAPVPENARVVTFRGGRGGRVDADAVLRAARELLALRESWKE